MDEDVCKLIQLETLNLSDNGIRFFPTVIFQLVTLTDLDISNNKLKHIPYEMVNLRNLMTLRLSNCRIRDFPDFVFQLKNLKILDLNFNYISRIPPQLQWDNLLLLEKLNLEYNDIFMLSDDFCNSILSLPSLSKCSLSGNPLPPSLYVRSPSFLFLSPSFPLFYFFLDFL